MLLSNLTGLSLHYLCMNEDEEEDGKSETESKDGERHTQAGGSSADADTLSAEKKDKGDQHVHVLFLQRSVFKSTVMYMCIHAGPPTCVGELRRWAHGDYTLLHDSVKREYALDLQLHMGCAGM